MIFLYYAELYHTIKHEGLKLESEFGEKMGVIELEDYMRVHQRDDHIIWCYISHEVDK